MVKPVSITELHARGFAVGKFASTDHLSQYNFSAFLKPEDLHAHVQVNRTDLGGLTYLVTADGYTNPPVGTETAFGKMVHEFLHGLADRLGGNQEVGFVAAPSTNKFYSVDFSATSVAHDLDLPVVYMTGDKYWNRSYVNVEPLNNGVCPIRFQKDEKYLLPTVEKSIEAGSLVSSSVVLFGGRNITLSDFIHMVNNHKKVVLVVDKDSKTLPHDHKGLQNTTRYLAELIAHKKDRGYFGQEDLLDFQQVKALIDRKWDFIENNVLVVELSSKGNKTVAVEEAAAFLAA